MRLPRVHPWAGLHLRSGSPRSAVPGPLLCVDRGPQRQHVHVSPRKDQADPQVARGKAPSAARHEG
eukprot:8994212-Heterocapsa_arctica.AAC.1